MNLRLLLYWDEYYNPETGDKEIMEINVAKNRNGQTRMCQVQFN